MSRSSNASRNSSGKFKQFKLRSEIACIPAGRELRAGRAGALQLAAALLGFKTRSARARGLVSIQAKAKRSMKPQHRTKPIEP